MTSQRKIEANRRNLTRRQGLTPEGRERLRLAALARRPWEASTGPRTAAGKAVSAQNATVHGRDTDAARAFRRDAFRFINLARVLRQAVLLGLRKRLDAHGAVNELVVLSGRLQAGSALGLGTVVGTK